MVTGTAAARITVRGGVALLDPSLVRHGRVNGRYFRENFAQGGIDLVQIIPELVTNADSAIALGGRPAGRIVLRFGAPDPGVRERAGSGRCGGCARRRCSTGATSCAAPTTAWGWTPAAVDRRLGALGVLPDASGQRGLFGRGLRDVWLAQGGGRIEGVRDGRRVESWFFPSGGDDPYAYVHVRDEPARGVEPDRRSGTRITVPLAAGRPPANARLRRLVGQLVQLRPVLEDPARQLWLELPGEGAQLVTLPAPEPDPERPLLADEEIEVAAGVRARVIVRRAAEPIPLSPSRATRLGGLVIRSGRAAHETTLAGHEGEPGTRHLYGEVICDALEDLQRAALDSPRPHVVVKVDRSGLNEHHPVVRELYAGDRAGAAPDRRRGGAPRRRASRPRRARGAGARPGRPARAQRRAARRVRRARAAPASSAAATPSDTPPSDRARAASTAARRPRRAAPARDAALTGALRFKQSPVRLHPGEDRGVSLRDRPGAGPARHAGRRSTADAGLRLKFWGEHVVPEPNRGGWSRMTGTLRARVSVDPGARLTVTRRGRRPHRRARGADRPPPRQRLGLARSRARTRTR